MLDIQPIHLPLGIHYPSSDEEMPRPCYALVYVKPDKEYNHVLGSTLIELFSVKQRHTQKPKEIPLYAIRLYKKNISDIIGVLKESIEVKIQFTITKTLPDEVIIKGIAVDPRALILLIEDLKKCKLYSRKHQRIMKISINLSFEIRGYITHDSLIVIGRHNDAYIIKGR